MLPAVDSKPRLVFTTVNQKGGVGKTTLACHLAFAARELGYSVLLIDLDTQGTASTILTRDITIARAEGGAGDLFDDQADLEPLATPAGIDLLHGHQHLDRVDRRSLSDAPQRPAVFGALHHEVVVIDTPPAIGTRHLAPLLWSDVALTPLEPTGPSIQGLAQTAETLALLRRLNPGIGCRVIVNRHIRRSCTQQANIRRLEKLMPLERPFLTQRVAVSDALDAGMPVWRFHRAPSELRRAWRRLCERLLRHGWNR